LHLTYMNLPTPAAFRSRVAERTMRNQRARFQLTTSPSLPPQHRRALFPTARLARARWFRQETRRGGGSGKGAPPRFLVGVAPPEAAADSNAGKPLEFRIQNTPLRRMNPLGSPQCKSPIQGMLRLAKLPTRSLGEPAGPSPLYQLPFSLAP
jgi:hypothetical protein